MVYADDTGKPALDPYEKEFMEGFEEISEIATKTKLNIDEMPAIVSILSGEELAKLGILNLHEALSLIPGVEISMEPSGAKQAIFRGVKEKGKVKLLIDGLTVNNAYRGSVYYAYNLPVEIIERVEVIRGPGSALYGDNAFVGVINVITKSAAVTGGKNGFFAGAGSEGRLIGGLTSTVPVGEGELSVDAYYQKSDLGVRTETDRATGSSGYISNAPGDSNEKMKDYSAGLFYNSDAFEVKLRTLKDQTGASFGISSFLERDDDLTANDNGNNFFEAAWKHELDNGVRLRLSGGYQNYKQSFETYFVTVASGDDIIYDLAYEEESYLADALFQYDGVENHHLVAGLHARHTKNLDTMLHAYFDQSGADYIAATPSVESGVDRTVTAAYLEDLYTVSPRLSLSAGLRYDHYSDFGSALSPRIAGVYGYSEESVFKAMYGRAFRAPSFIEMTADIPGLSIGDDQLEAEYVDTLELAYIHKQGLDKVFRTNFYLSKFSDIIYRNGTTRVYEQIGDSEIYGLEAEYKGRIDQNNRFALNGSYMIHGDEAGKPIPDVADRILNGWFFHDRGALTSATQIQYVGERRRAAGDTREALEAYHLLNQTFSYRFSKKIKGRLALKNLLDEEVRYPAAPGTYDDDLPRPGRMVYANVNIDF